MNEKYNLTFGFWCLFYLAVPSIAFSDGWNIACFSPVQDHQVVSCTPGNYSSLWITGIGLGSCFFTALASRLKPDWFDTVGINGGIFYGLATGFFLHGAFSLEHLAIIILIITPVIAAMLSNFKPPDEIFW